MLVSEAAPRPEWFIGDRDGRDAMLPRLYRASCWKNLVESVTRKTWWQPSADTRTWTVDKQSAGRLSRLRLIYKPCLICDAICKEAELSVLPVSLVSRRLPRHPVIVLLWDRLRSLPIRHEWICTTYTVPLCLLFLPYSSISYSLQVRHLSSHSSHPRSSTRSLWLPSTSSSRPPSRPHPRSPPLCSSFLATSFPLAAIRVRNPCLSAVIHASRNIVQWIYPSTRGDGWRQDALGAEVYGCLRFQRIE